MDKRFVIPFGFVLMLTMAVMGTLALFNLTGLSPAEASINDTFNDTRVNLDPLKVSSAPSTLTIADNAVTVDPNDPGALTRLEARFTLGATGSELNNGVDTILLRFDEDFQVPPSIDRNNVSISATQVTGTGQVPGSPNVAVAPQVVTVDFVGTENNEPEITITVPDMDPGDNTGGNGIAAGATVAVIFSQAAGIRNPTEGDAGGYFARISTSKETAPVETDVIIPFVVELDTAADPRNTEVTLVGRGFRNATTTTFWRDANGDGNRDPGELDICSALTGDDDVATCTFTITNPPFAPSLGTDCDIAATDGDGLENCNYINAIDGRNNRSTQLNQTDVDQQTFELEGQVTASPTTGDPGDTLTVQLRDFPQGNVTNLTVGGVAVAGINQSVPVSGEVNFSVDIPNGVPTGTQALAVREPITNELRRTNIEIGGATLIPTPDEVVPNQRITLIGTGFTEGGAATINANAGNTGITIGGQMVSRDDINEGQTIQVDNGGSWSASLDIPVLSSTTVGGPRELKVVDSAGRDGDVMITFPERELTLTPPEARVGTDVTIRGTGFPGRIQGSSVSVDILYDAATGDRTTTATPDASGNFSVTLQVPLEAGIPSTNTVRATFSDDSGIEVVTTAPHEVPRASITIDPTSGPPGTSVTLTAEGFRRFTPVTTIEVGGTDVTPSPKPSTDANGAMTFDFIVPGLETGTQTVEMDVRNVTGSAGFTVTEGGEGEATGATTSLAQAVEPLRDNLVRVFRFNNTTKEWSFHDPRSEFAEANTLDQFAAGEPYWIRVEENQTVELNGESRNLTCINAGTPQEDCWNLIVW